MSLELLVIVLYVAYILILNLQIGLSPAISIGYFIDIPMLIQAVVSGLVFFSLVKMKKLFNNNSRIIRIIFFIVGILLSVVNVVISLVNGMIYLDENVAVGIYFAIYMLPIFYCSIISLLVGFIENRIKDKSLNV